MKCSTKKAPMGTMPDKECRRRKRNEVPCPARRGATPRLIIGGAGLAVAATETLLVSSNVRRELFIILSPGKGSQERENARASGKNKERRIPGLLVKPSTKDIPQHLIKEFTRSQWSGLGRGWRKSTAGTAEMPLHDDCSWPSLLPSIRRRSSEFAEKRKADHSQNHSRREAPLKLRPRLCLQTQPASGHLARQQ